VRSLFYSPITVIEGSLQLLKELRESYAGLLAEHHHLLRTAFANWAYCFVTGGSGKLNRRGR
jgi:hypothetical protein